MQCHIVGAEPRHVDVDMHAMPSHLSATNVRLMHPNGITSRHDQTSPTLLTHVTLQNCACLQVPDAFPLGAVEVHDIMLMQSRLGALKVSVCTEKHNLEKRNPV